ncbi:hypothetical protein DFH06DRAFT_332146 [Mycena polygramma]|nr:hypothetical protein DFH06DRAFT_332146 [Mycena polygramma]
MREAGVVRTSDASSGRLPVASAAWAVHRALCPVPGAGLQAPCTPAVPDLRTLDRDTALAHLPAARPPSVEIATDRVDVGTIATRVWVGGGILAARFRRRDGASRGMFLLWGRVLCMEPFRAGARLELLRRWGVKHHTWWISAAEARTRPDGLACMCGERGSRHWLIATSERECGDRARSHVGLSHISGARSVGGGSATGGVYCLDFFSFFFFAAGCVERGR